MIKEMHLYWCYLLIALATLPILNVGTRGFDIVSGKGFFSDYRNQVAYPEMMYV